MRTSLPLGRHPGRRSRQRRDPRGSRLPWRRRQPGRARPERRHADLLHCTQPRPERVVDTLGAGDCFNAGVIDGLLRGLPPGEAVARAVRLAGYKCGRYGLDGLIQDAARAGIL
ncbi:PfkB family carbohydrate kinase [Thiocystis violascens]|uniref:PfkB family carbohydrate kinase n=1 Tax=Thiocystis violascens TaxID=73141 RepID=UPI001C26546F